MTRADGRVENYGVVAYYHRHPVRNLIGQLQLKIRRFFNDRRFAAQAA